jgi:hypothetical protein
MIPSVPAARLAINIVMAGQQPVEDGRERPYVPAIHVLIFTLPRKGVHGRDKVRP